VFVPAIWLLYQFGTGQFGPVPLGGMTCWSGLWAMALLLLALAITPALTIGFGTLHSSPMMMVTRVSLIVASNAPNPDRCVEQDRCRAGLAADEIGQTGSNCGRSFRHAL
jgi:hypothetical protein